MIFCKNQWANSEGKKNIAKFWSWGDSSIRRAFASQTQTQGPGFKPQDPLKVERGSMCL